MENQRQGFVKTPRVTDHVPETRKTVHALHSGKVDIPGAQNIVWRFWVVSKLVLVRMSINRRTAQAFQYSKLNFLRLQAHQLIETFGEVFEAVRG